MKLFISLLILSFTLAALGQVNGDVYQVKAGTNAWDVFVYVKGKTTGGTYNYGLATIRNTDRMLTNIPTSLTPFLTVQSPGYDDTGSAISVTRTVYLTHEVRQAYPNQALIDETNFGSDVILHSSLSDPIFKGETAVGYFPLGWYTQSGGNNLSSGVTVNMDTITLNGYPKVIAKFSWPDHNRVTGNTMPLHVVAFQMFGQRGRPVRCVKFIATDQHGHSVTNIETKAKIDGATPDYKYIAEYFTSIDMSTLVNGDQIRCDFIAYPWIGDSTSVCDTTLDTYHWPTTFPCANTNYYQTNDYGARARVASTGSDSTGRAVTNQSLSSVTLPFLTIGAACKAIAASNNLYFSHNDTGDGLIGIDDTAAWVGTAATSIGPTPKCWLRITNYGGNAQLSNNVADSSSQPCLVKYEGLRIDPSSGNSWSTTSNLWRDDWFHQCFITASNASQMSISGSVNAECLTQITDSTVDYWAQGFRSTGTAKHAFNIVRGNYCTRFNHGMAGHLLMGNVFPDTNGPSKAIQFDFGATQTEDCGDWSIVFDNQLYGEIKVGGQMLSAPQFFNITNGIAIIQNLFEECTNGGFGYLGLCDTTGIQVTNMIFWYNNGQGTKNFFCYDWESGTTWRIWCSFVGNIFGDHNIKSDVISVNSAAIGNWMMLYGCGFSKNVFIEVSSTNASASIGAPGQFLHEFCGLYGMSTNVSASANSYTNLYTWPAFKNYKASDGLNLGVTAGSGDYHLTSGSPIVFCVSPREQDWKLAYGLDGNTRSINDVPGPYAKAGNPR